MTKESSDLFPDHEDLHEKEWNGMPEFVQKDLTPLKQLTVSFNSIEDYQEFAELIEQPLTSKTRSIWYPKAEIGRTFNQRYINKKGEKK